MNKPQTKACDSVMERIKCGEVSPRSRGWFTCLECYVWTSWLITVLIGSVAVAVIVYVVVNGWYGFYEATDMSRLAMTLHYVPAVWLVVLCITAYFAVRNMRHLKQGYRYPAWLLLTSSIGLSALIGLLLYILGFGFMADSTLGETMPMYSSYAHQQESFWQAPEHNRWLGMMETDTEATFTDITGDRWQVSIDNLTAAEAAILTSGKRVRLLGLSPATSSLIACGVFSWHEDKAHSPKYLADERAKVTTWLETVRGASTSCAELPVLKRRPY